MTRMTTGRNELRMIWLVSLLILAASTWYLDQRVLSLFCGLGFLVSVMQYVTAVQVPTELMAQALNVPIRRHSKVPLYISSIVAVIGAVSGLNWLMGIGITAWIYFLLRWLQRLEISMLSIQTRLQHQHALSQPVVLPSRTEHTDTQEVTATSENRDSNFVEQIQAWIFKGNPVLKAAIVILMVGVVLLLRFATENWQISLATKLGIVALVSAAVTFMGYMLQRKNRSFALALEGLGLGVLFLTLFFAYYNLVIPALIVAAILFLGIMLVTLFLSLKQESVELALMAMLIAYIAPFTLPIREASSVEFISYYLVINLAVAVLSSLRPWKMLNQIAFLITAIVGGIYGLLHIQQSDRFMLTALILAHSAVFIWLGLRFSQLLAQSDLRQFKLKPILDIALIFAAPITAYAFLYLIHFNDIMWQAGLSLIFAVVFACCWMWTRRSQTIAFVAQSYLSLMLIFLALIPPILLKGEWSVIGWALEGAVIYVWALERNVNVARYLSMGFLLMAGASSLYYLVEMNPSPDHIFWLLSSVYLMVVLISQLKAKYQQQLDTLAVSFLSLLSFSGSLMLLMLIQDQALFKDNDVLSLLIVVIVFSLMNELISRQNKTWTWSLPKWSGIAPLMLIAIILIFDQSRNAMIMWDSQQERWAFAIAALLLSRLWVHPISALHLSKEVVSFGVLLSLALCSLSFIPTLPYISVVILPLLFCGWSYQQKAQSLWHLIWQSKSSVALMLTWMIFSQLFSQHAFSAYLLPILNPFDLVSLAMLTAFMWVLLQHMKQGQDKGLIAVMMVLSLLWLSSYIVLRALHIYVQTPLNSLDVWSNATVQLSLTILWVLLAFMTMWIATFKKLKPLWILGGSILVVVTLKLVLLDLSHTGTLTRVLSFLMAGGVMLIIAYIAPMPESVEKE